MKKRKSSLPRPKKTIKIVQKTTQNVKNKKKSVKKYSKKILVLISVETVSIPTKKMKTEPVPCQKTMKPFQHCT